MTFDDKESFYEAQAEILGADADYWKEWDNDPVSGGLRSDTDAKYYKGSGKNKVDKTQDLIDAYNRITANKAKEAAERETGEIASTASDTAIRESTNALRSAGQSKGQSALGGGNVGAVTYGNTFINNHGAVQSSAMNKLYEQLQGQQELEQMKTALANEENAQKAQLKQNIMSTIGDVAQGFATGGWAGAAAGLLF